jgi:hypothetical protein
MTVPHDIESQLSSLETTLQEQKEHQLREERFALEANDRFAKNLEVFEKYYPEIFKSVKEYQPRNDFCIHVTKSGYGNFFPKNKNAALYGDDPIKQAREQVEKAAKNPTFTLTEYTKYDPNNKDNRLHIRYMHRLGKLISDYKAANEVKTLTTLPDSFPTAMIFGIGLGYHIEEIIYHTDFTYVFIVEPDFELFFASLFYSDWHKIITYLDEKNACLFLHLGSTNKDFINDLSSIADDIGAFSLVRSFCFQHYPDKELNALLEQFFIDYFRFQFGFGFYNDAITGFAHSFYHLNNNLPFYDANNDELSSLSDVPVFIVGNGPSLDESREFLVKNQDKAIIVACGTALGSLYRMGITADFHVLVERPYKNYQVLFDMVPESVYKNLNLLSLNMIYPDTPFLYKWAGLALKGNESGSDFINFLYYYKYKKSYGFLSYSNPLVSNTGLSFFTSFGFKNVYLFGVDNGKLKKAKHHSSYSIYSNKTGRKYWPQLMRDGTLPGNLGGVVDTGNLFRVSNSQIEKLIELKRLDRVINVGQGALINGAYPAHSDELIDLSEKINKESIIEHIKEQFRPMDIPVDNLDSVKSMLNEIVSSLIDYASYTQNSIDLAWSSLLKQQRYLYSFCNTEFNFVFKFLKGTLLYYHCPMVTALYQYENADDNLELYLKINELWLEYLKEIKEHFPKHLDKKCDWAFD